MSVLIQGDQIRAIALGTRVEKSLSPTAATVPIFTVTGGRVVITSIAGLVTTVMSATATSLSLTADPTVGVAGALSAATVVTSDEAGTQYGVTGTAADLLSAQGPAGTEVPVAAYAKVGAGLVIGAGVINQVGTAINTGVVKWTITYVALDDNAAVVAA